MSRLYLIPSTLVIFLILLPSNTLAEVRTYPPTANLASPYNGDTFYDGETFYLFDYGSTGNGSPITQRRWRMRPIGGSWTNISWSSSDFYSFPNLAPGQRRQTYELQLTVWNSFGSDSETIQVTVVRDYESYYYLKDHLGTVRTTINDQGNVVGYDDYYPFGLQMPGRSSNTGNPNDNYKFTGHERDDEASLTLDYMKARNYDPVLGRFQQIDPLAQKFPGWSPYNYTMNNPINMWDPDGRAPTSCCYGLGAATSTAKAMERGPKALKEHMAARQKASEGYLIGASFYIPGPEDAAIGIFAATKVGRAAARLGDETWGAVKGLFQRGDVIVDAASSSKRSFRLADQDGNAKIYEFEVGDKTVEFDGVFFQKDGVLTIDNFNIEGDLVNEVGIKGLKDIVQDFGQQQGVNKVVINGTPRTTGANPGKVTKLEFDIEQ